MLTTSTIGTILPQFVDEYGPNKKIDVVLSPSHDLFLDGVPKSKMTGLYMDKNGNIKMQLNIPAQLNVEKSRGQWESVRNIFITLVVKVKLQQHDGATKYEKNYSFTPKSIEMSNLVIKNGEELIMNEQMMLQSLVNIQLEQLKRTFFTTESMSLGRLITALNKRDIVCFGFNITDLDIAFKKSSMQLSLYQKPLAKDDLTEAQAKSCTDLFNELITHQATMLEQLQSNDNPFTKGMNKFKDGMDKMGKKDKQKKLDDPFKTDDL